jgi:DNA-binding NarL/FixJ family response regulator
MIRIVVIDDHEPDLNLIRGILSAQRDFEIAGVGRDAYHSLRMIGDLRPDIVILDTHKYIDGAEFAVLLKRKFPAIASILFTNEEREEYIRKAIGGNVSGYLLKKSDLDELPSTVRCVYRGGHCISPRISDKALRILSVLLQDKGLAAPRPFQGPPLPPDMSQRELKIIHSLALGRSNKEIAEDLKLKAGTVRNYVSSAIQKAGLRNRTEAAMFALRNGLVVSQ